MVYLLLASVFVFRIYCIYHDPLPPGVFQSQLSVPAVTINARKMSQMSHMSVMTEASNEEGEEQEQEEDKDATGDQGKT